jgi:hypothetical protein
MLLDHDHTRYAPELRFYWDIEWALGYCEQTVQVQVLQSELGEVMQSELGLEVVTVRV